MPPPDISVRGIRGPIPSGYVLGRQSAGNGPPELISLAGLTTPLQNQVTSVFGRSGLIVATAGDYNTGQLTCSSAADSASAGQLGQYVEGELLSGAATSLVAGVIKDVVSISLTAGDWDAWAQIGWTLTGATGNQCFAWISSASATFPTFTNKGAFLNYGGGVVANFAASPVGQRRFSLAAPATIYLSTQVTFGGSVAAFGFLAARRVR